MFAHPLQPALVYFTRMTFPSQSFNEKEDLFRTTLVVLK